MSDTAYCPDRGDIIWLYFRPGSGHEQRGRRPALVLSPSAYNGKVGLALVCSITSQIKGYPFEVLLPEKSPVSGVVLSDQVRSLDWRARHAECACKASETVVDDVVAKLSALIPK